MQQQGGSHHGAPPPETSLSFAPAEAASPLSSRPAPRPPASVFDEYGPGEEGGGPANRWPRQETLSLLKIRSEMDPAFRDATLKGPLWEDVSRKLAELGYTRSAKKCKEKFENVHKYYKRTKEGRAGRQDGKSYRFFSQLEALHSPSAAAAAAAALIPTSLLAIQPPSATTPALPPVDSLPGGISFSSSTSSSSSSDSDGEETEEGGICPPPHEGQRKRKRRNAYLKMMDFFDRLMKQMMDRQEAMQNRFLETIEKREQDRLIREEAWKRQEMVRLNREHELMAQERAIAASRDAAVISFLQKFADNPPPPRPTATEAAPPSPEKKTEIGEPAAVASQPCSSSEPAISPSSSPSRWPKPEVLALIRMRSGLETRYLEAGPKGPLWEEISLGMKRLGYNRNAKRCKEKWENINKYFKKVKEGNKKRPEDAKTCPYFHELDALYRKKHTVVTGDPLRTPAIAGIEDQRQNNQASMRIGDSISHEPGEAQLPRSNGGGAPQLFFGGASPMKKPEDIVRELMGQQIPQSRPATAARDYEKLGGGETVDSDMGNHEYEDDEDYDDNQGDVKLQYEIQFQSKGAGPVPGGGARSGSAATAASSAGSFLAMVQ